nr:integrase, catalytic region, zinc finger, CCHC-type, peptidase aspartic, catalytic [Tanacetum cinerariifolium]
MKRCLNSITVLRNTIFPWKSIINLIWKSFRETLCLLQKKIKSSRVQSKEQYDDLINKVNLKSVEVVDLNASLQEKVLVIIALKEQLKGKAVLTKVVSLNPIDPALLHVDVVPLVPKLRKNRTAHIDYIRHTQEEAATLRELVESERLLSPLNTSLAYACKYTRRIQELLMILQQTCPKITDLGTNLVAVTPKNQTKQIRRTAQIRKSEKTYVATSPSPNIDSNTHVLSSTGVALVSSASGLQSQDNTKKNRIRRTHKKAKATKLEDHPRKVKFSLNKASVVDSKSTSSVIKKSKSARKPVKRKVWKSTGKVFKTVGYIWKPTGRTFTLVGNVCPLTRIATATIVPLREPIPIVKIADTPVVTLVYTRKPKAKNVPNKMEPNKSWGSSSNVSTPITDCRLSKSSSGIWTPIMGYGDYQIGNVMISRVYYVEGLGHNLFSVGQFCDSDLKVAFRQHTCFIRNLEGVDLLTGVALVSSASGSQSQDNTKKNRIQRTHKKAKETKLEDHHRKVKSGSSFSPTYLLYSQS